MDDRSWSVDGLLLAPGATLPLALTDSVTYHFAITSATGLTHYVTASLSRRRFVFHRHGARRRRGRGCWIRRRYARRATGWWLQWIDVQAAARPEWRAAERDKAQRGGLRRERRRVRGIRGGRARVGGRRRIARRACAGGVPQRSRSLGARDRHRVAQRGRDRARRVGGGRDRV